MGATILWGLIYCGNGLAAELLGREAWNALRAAGFEHGSSSDFAAEVGDDASEAIHRAWAVPLRARLATSSHVRPRGAELAS